VRRRLVACSILLLLALGGPVFAATPRRTLEGVVNLNTATAEELQLLPGVGPAKVRDIVAYRSKHPFRTVEELVRIKGIGRKMFRRLRLHLTVSGPTTAQQVIRASARSPLPEPPPLLRRPIPHLPPPGRVALLARRRPPPSPPPAPAPRVECLRGP
jgi:competence protein ComEA